MKLLEQAIEYARRGWNVFPLFSIDKEGNCTCGQQNCSDAGKHPRIDRGLKDASRDLEKIEQWFGSAAPPSNIAIATGERSGITVLDIDTGPGKFGAESWADIVAEHGEPDTLIAKTGGGGMHVFFQYNSVLKTASNVLGKGIDSRNDGGYVVGPPSKHRSGKLYVWDNWGTALAALPAHLAKRKEQRGRPKKDDMYYGKYSIEQVNTMLEFVPADDRDLWRSIGIILGREFARSEAAWELYKSWADKWKGRKGRNHEQIMYEAFHDLSQQSAERTLTIGTIVKAALDNGWAPKAGEVPIGNFVFFGPGNNYIYRPTISYWIASAVDSAVSPMNENGKLVKASDWLRKNQLVTSITNDPAVEENYVKGYDSRDGEIVSIEGAALFNTYRKPTIEMGDAKLAKPFVNHCRILFNKQGDCDQFLDYMAHRVQRPEEKPRFALLIAGGQGVGKDTAVEFCCPAIGQWNVANIDPSAFESSFNEFAAATLVRINEAANLHEMSKWAFNERTKVLIAGTPDSCQINQKYGQKFTVRMHCGVIITTNHSATGIYIPADDRRYDVIESATLDEMKLRDDSTRRKYFEELWAWFLDGGANHVAAYLAERDISGFSASNGQRKTNAHQSIVAAGMSGDQWLTDILDELNWPDAARSDIIMTKALTIGEKEGEVKRKIGPAMGRADYILFRNPIRKDGRWPFGDKRVSVYVKIGTPPEFDPSSSTVLAEEQF